MIMLKEKLQVIEHFIEQWRIARNGDPGERAVYHTLKAIAEDIRARDRKRATDLITRMDRAMKNAERWKTKPTGYQPGNLREIAELTIGAWPTIRQALEDFENER